MAHRPLILWKQRGSIYLWRYVENTKNYPGWHFATDQSGYASMIDLLRSFTLEPLAVLQYRTIYTTSPSAGILAIPNNRRTAIVAAEKLRITLSSTPDEWTLEEVMPAVHLTLGLDRIYSMIAWLGDVDRAFDTSFGDPPRLWSWGILNHR